MSINTYRVKVVLYLGPTLLKSTSTKFPKKNSHCTHCIHCFNCTFCTFLCAKLCANFIPQIERDDSPEQRAAAFSFRSSLKNHALLHYGTDSLQVRTHRPSCCFSSSSQLKTMTIFVRSPSGLVADWSIKSRPSGNAS